MGELFKLKNGTVLVSTEAPGGIYNSAQLKKIADLCSKELAIVKATEDQRLALFVKEAELDRVVSELKATGLGFRHYQEGLHQPVSCLGELCESHEQPALTTAMDLTKLVAAINLTSPLKIGINGCARCCTPCHTLDISVIGEASGYRVSLGGKTSQFPELASFFAEAIPAKDLPRLLATVVELFKAKAEPGETFVELLDRAGTEDFVSALAPYSQDAAHRDDPFATPDVAAEIDDSALMDLPSEEIMGEEAIPMDDAPAADEDVVSDEMSFDFSSDDDTSTLLEEIPIEGSDEPALSDDILVHGGEEPSLEDDATLTFDDESPLSDDELLTSEPDLIDEDTVELAEADVPELTEEMAEMPELGEELLSTNELESGVETDLTALDEGDEGSALDSEEERLFEEKIKASIEEDKKLRDTEEVDENLSARADALRLLESAGDDDIHTEEMIISDESLLNLEDESSVDEDDVPELEIEDQMDDVSDLEVEEARAVAAVIPQKIVAKPAVAQRDSSQEFDFEGFDLFGETLRVSFGSGAYLDVELDSLGSGQTRTFRAGRATVRVTHNESGYSVEGGGMKMFYPHGILKAS